MRQKRCALLALLFAPSSFGQSYPYAPPAPVVIAQTYTLGPFTSGTSASSATISSIVSTNNSIVLLEGSIQATGVTATYNTNACTADVNGIEVNTSGYYLYLFSCQVTSGTTAAAVFSWSGNHHFNVQSAVLSMTKQAPADVSGNCVYTAATTAPSAVLGASGMASGTPPSCPGSTSTSAINEACIGVLANASNLIGGTWQNGFTFGQHTDSGSGGSISDAYLVLNTTQNVTAGVMSAASNVYAAGIACYEHL